MRASNTLQAQRSRLLKRLQEKEASTLELRHELDILAVAPRVHELRHQFGFNIQTHWTNDRNPGGGYHRVAKYVLLAGKYKEGKQNG